MRDLKHRVQVCATFTMLREGLIDHFIRHGLNPEIGIDAEAIEHYSRQDFADVASPLRQHGLGITLHAPFVDLSAGSTDPAIRGVTRRRFEELLELVPLFQPRTVVAHAGYDWQRYGYFRNVWLDHSTRFWSDVAERLHRAGCRLMLENVYEHGPEEIRELFERLRANHVGLCLDCGHLTVFGRAPLAEWLEVLGPLIGQLHLHDNAGQKDEHLAMGQGRIDFRPLFAYLKAERPRPPVVTMEVHRPDDLWESLDYLQRLWPWGE
jgi:sugar phosphate isomerase/epimerase